MRALVYCLRSGQWDNEQVISKRFVDETFQLVWDNLTNATIQTGRGYSLHWWISRHDNELAKFLMLVVNLASISSLIEPTI